MRRLILSFVGLTVAACGDPPPSPTAPPGPDVPAVTATRIALVSTPGELPIGGGSARIFIETAAGSLAAPRVTVSLSATSGVLDQQQVTTDTTGHAAVSWTGNETATINASSGSLSTSTNVRVLLPAVFIPSPPPPAPPPPVPTPEPPPGPPTLRVTLRAGRSITPVGTDVDLYATIDPNSLMAGESILAYQWDCDGDKTFETTTVGAMKLCRYNTHGTVQSSVNALSSASRSATATVPLVVTNQ